MKTKRIHELNTHAILMLIDEFGLAVDFYFYKMVELEKSIRNVKSKKIKFDEGCVEREVNLIGKIVSRCLD